MTPRKIDMVRLTKIALLGQDIARDASAAGGFTAPMITAAAKQAIGLMEKDGTLKQNERLVKRLPPIVLSETETVEDVVIQMQPAVSESAAPAN